MDWIGELSKQVRGPVVTEESERGRLSRDFGGVIARKPAVVVRPASTEDVAGVVRFAVREGLRVATRGGGHSQSGQSLSDQILLDMTSLAGVRAHDSESVRCQAGLSWRSLAGQLAEELLSPPVLTNNLDVTLGGTLSTGGLGVASWRRGTQADQCLALEVVTGEGEIVRCSAESNRELFDAVRAGMGQFGVITEATLRLRRHQPGFCCCYLLHDDFAALLDDLQVLMAEERFDYLESWCVPCPQGFRSLGAEPQAFAQWFYPLHATFETDGQSAAPPAAKLQGLRYYKHVHTENGDLQKFFARLDPLFAVWKRVGFWEYAHPWMECVLPWSATSFYVSQVLANMPPQAIAGGHILLWPARGGASQVPMFQKPPGEYVMGFGILPAVPQRFLPDALPRLNQASAAAMMMGGKRYLSGWVDFAPEQWRAHYGDQWPDVVRLKKKYDPRGVLNPGFMKFE